MDKGSILGRIKRREEVVVVSESVGEPFGQWFRGKDFGQFHIQCFIRIRKEEENDLGKYFKV